jgi:hypothetical protein
MRGETRSKFELLAILAPIRSLWDTTISLRSRIPRRMSSNRPSSIRVLAKSLHLLAVGWLATVVWLWTAQVQVNISRFGVAPEGYAYRTLIEGLLPAMLVELMAIGMDSLLARVGGRGDPRREWWYAFVWTAVPIALLFGTVYLMIRA